MPSQIEEAQVAREIAGMDRQQVVYELMNFDGSVRLDFTDEFVSRQSIEQLKHILVAAKTQISPRLTDRAKLNAASHAP